MKLNVSTINSLTKPGRYSDGRNLYLNVSSTGAKSWLFIWRAINGKQRELGLGSYTGAGAAFAIGLKEARLAADKVRTQIAAGIDPIEQRVAARIAAAVSSITFADILTDVLAIQKKSTSWKARPDGTFKQEEVWLTGFRIHAPALMKKRVATVTEQTIIDIVSPIWPSPTASNLLFRINKVMELAIARKLHPGPNPARYESNIEVVVGKKVSKLAANGGHKELHYDDLPALWQQLMTDTASRTKALAFLILTGVRSEEARLMVRSEVDFVKKTWTVPAARMKTGKVHVVPLSTQALDLLRSIPETKGNPYFFVGERGDVIGDSAMRDRLCDPIEHGGLNLRGSATVHGFRKTLRNWCGDKLRGYTTQDFEMCLAHSVGGVEGVYRTETALEKRAEIMQAWANYTTGQNVNVIKLAA